MNRISCTRFVTSLMVVMGLLLGCSNYDSTSQIAEGPKGFAIGAVTSVKSGESAKKNGETLYVDCTEPLLVSVLPEPADDSMGGFLLAAPGSCGSTVDCGWLELTVNGENGKELQRITTAKSPIRVDIPVETVKTTNEKTRKTEEVPVFHRDEALLFHLELRDADGFAVKTDDDKPLVSELSVVLSTAKAANPGCK